VAARPVCRAARDDFSPISLTRLKLCSPRCKRIQVKASFRRHVDRSDSRCGLGPRRSVRSGVRSSSVLFATSAHLKLCSPKNTYTGWATSQARQRREIIRSPSGLSDGVRRWAFFVGRHDGHAARVHTWPITKQWGPFARGRTHHARAGRAIKPRRASPIAGDHWTAHNRFVSNRSRKTYIHMNVGSVVFGRDLLRVQGAFRRKRDACSASRCSAMTLWLRPFAKISIWAFRFAKQTVNTHSCVVRLDWKLKKTINVPEYVATITRKQNMDCDRKW